MRVTILYYIEMAALYQTHKYFFSQKWTELFKMRVVAGAYDRVGINEVGLQVAYISKLVLPFNEPYYSLIEKLPDIVILYLMAGGFNEAPGLVQRACVPEGPNLSFHFLLSLNTRNFFWHAFCCLSMAIPCKDLTSTK